jgi:probable phosphoglycerate mutase
MNRVVPALHSLVADQAWDTALAVLHGGVNRAILSYALTAQLVFIGGFEQAPACINVLDVDDAGRWIVRVVNSAEHLAVTEHLRSTTMEEYYAEFVSTRSRKAQTSSPNDPGSSSIGA